MSRKKASQCKNGHEYTPESTREGANGKRTCRTCQREATERWRERKGGLKPGRGANNAAKTHCAKGHPFDDQNTVWTIVKATGRPRRACRECNRLNAVQQRFKKYGLTEESYNAMLEEQGGVCAICHDGFEGGFPHIDHYHDGGHAQVRGILCYSCNNGLGAFGDSPERLIAAAEYLMSSDRWSPTT